MKRIYEKPSILRDDLVLEESLSAVSIVLDSESTPVTIQREHTLTDTEDWIFDLEPSN